VLTRKKMMMMMMIILIHPRKAMGDYVFLAV
jgi:hypothetical protein